MSKGSKRRPTDEAAYADAYDRIFGNGVRPVHEHQGEAGATDGDSEVHAPIPKTATEARG